MALFRATGKTAGMLRREGVPDEEILDLVSFQVVLDRAERRAYEKAKNK